MASRITTQIGIFLVATFGIWYFLRRTSLGSAYAGEMMMIPQGISEGLRSTQTLLV